MALLHPSFIHAHFAEEETETDGSCKASISNVNNLSTSCPHCVLHLPGMLPASGKSKEGPESPTGHIALLCIQSRRAERPPLPVISCQVLRCYPWSCGINHSGDGALWLSPNVFALKPVIPV